MISISEILSTAAHRYDPSERIGIAMFGNGMSIIAKLLVLVGYA